MKRRFVCCRPLSSLLLLAAVTALCGPLASPTRAGPGLNLSWDHCGPAGVEARSFACDTNLGYDTFVASLVVPPQMWPFDGLVAHLHFTFDASFVPSWWAFREPSDCKPFSFVPSLSSESVNGCVNHWGGATVRLLPPRPSVAYAERVASVQIWGSPAEPWAPGEEVFLFKVAVTRDQTIGPDACPGCGSGAEIEFGSLWTLVGAQLDVEITQTADRKIIHWNGGLTPTARRTWSEIKALYR